MDLLTIIEFEMNPQYIAGAEPLFIKGENRGCLLLHGAGGGTPWDLKEFAAELYNRTAMTVWLPALTGFGTKPEDLFNITFEDWYTDAQYGIARLRETCDRIFVVGHSLGGVLTLLLASEHNDINGIVTWSAPFKVRHRLLPVLPIISKIPLLRRAVPEKFWVQIPESLKQQGWIGYDWIPPQVGLAAYEGMNRLKKSLQKVQCPAFIIQGSEDVDVSKDSAQKIYNSITSEKKELWIVKGADHPIMNNVECKHELFTRTITFLEQI